MVWSEGYTAAKHYYGMLSDVEEALLEKMVAECIAESCLHGYHVDQLKRLLATCHREPGNSSLCYTSLDFLLSGLL